MSCLGSFSFIRADLMSRCYRCDRFDSALSTAWSLIEWSARQSFISLPARHEKRVSYLALSGLGTVLDLGQYVRLDPDRLVRDALGVGLRFPDQRCQTIAQIRSGGLVEPVVDLAGIDEISSFAAADIDAVSMVAVEGEARDRQRLALRTCLFDPVSAARAGRIDAVADLRHDALESHLAGVCEHLAAVDVEAFAELNGGAGDELLQHGLAVLER
jgi:hypothetical protein